MEEKIKIENCFSEQDKEFNRTMVNNSMRCNNEKKSMMFKDRNYDFSSDIINEFYKKWNIKA